MSYKEFRRAYDDSNITILKTYIKKPKILSTKQIAKFVSESFLTKPKIFDIIIQILFAHYDINKILSIVIDLDKADLLEYLLNYDDLLLLDENLIQKTAQKGKITMAKTIYEYIYGENDLKTIKKLLRNYDWSYNTDEISIDSFILSIYYGEYDNALQIIDWIIPNFWDDFAIRYCVKYFVNDMWKLVEKLLRHNSVDPGANDNFALKMAIKKQKYELASTLLKHPLVQIENINWKLVHTVIGSCHFCVAERLLNSGDGEIINIFRQPDIIDYMIEQHNLVTYLAIKMGIFSVKRLLETYPEQKSQIKKYIRELIIDEPYALKPFCLNLDPEDLFIFSCAHKDPDQIKEIKSYAISISPNIFLIGLNLFPDISDYLWENIVKDYDPNVLLLKQLVLYSALPEKIDLIRLFNDIKNDPRLKCENVYQDCCQINDVNIQSACKENMKKLIEKKYNKKDYKKFCLKYAIG